MSAISILVADDHAIFRRGLRALIESQPTWKVVAEASDGREAVEQAARLHPDVAILDVGMPQLNGLDATLLILKASPRTRVLILTMHEEEELIQKTLKAGAGGYLLKTDAERDLITTVDALLRGKTVFTSAASKVILNSLRDEPGTRRAEVRHAPLSIREREVIQLLAEGKSNKEVASILDISTRTVEHHRARVMEKLNLHSLSDLVRYSIRNKMVEP